MQHCFYKTVIEGSDTKPSSLIFGKGEYGSWKCFLAWTMSNSHRDVVDGLRRREHRSW
jgi:hypothetical protein